MRENSSALRKETAAPRPAPDYETVDLRASSLVESVRASGCSPPAAIADLIDDSIAARAPNVWITSIWAQATPRSSFLISVTGLMIQDELLPRTTAGGWIAEQGRVPRGDLLIIDRNWHLPRQAPNDPKVGGSRQSWQRSRASAVPANQRSDVLGFSSRPVRPPTGGHAVRDRDLAPGLPGIAGWI
jgi:hypothetical protein